MTSHLCEKCGVRLTSDEIALHRKLLNRAAKSFWCLDCQAIYCNTTRITLEKLIEKYHSTGLCSLFAKTE